MVALAVVLAVLVGFVVRLVDIQVVNADEHIEDSLEWAFSGSRPLHGTRGAIVDAAGNTLAGSMLRYDVVIDPKNTGDITRTDEDDATTTLTWPEASGLIGTVTGQAADDIQRIVADALTADPDDQYEYVQRGVTTEQYRALADLRLPYLTFEQHPARTYPDGAVAGNLVGFMGTDEAPLAGLEKSEDGCLAATNGELHFQRGKDGVIIPGTETEEPAEDGGTLQLTIDRDLQWYLMQLIAEQVQDMGALSGSIMVTEVSTGKIRAAAEFPSVDPNNVTTSKDEDRASRIFTNWFEPGSTFKALTAATVIDAGGQSTQSTVVASSTETFANGARVRDSFVHPAFTYTLTGVLIDSSNAGISRFSEAVDPQTRHDYLARFGVGQGSDVDFLGEQSGLLRPVAEWDNQTVYNTTYGQGLTTTLPELVGAYGAIANDGERMPLTLVEGCTAADGTVTSPDLPAPTRVISESTATQVQQILENVALQANYAEQVAVPGYRIAVKTGTGEKSDPVTGGYKAGAYFTTMIGFAPADDPQYVVAVTLDEPSKVKSSAANATAFQQAMTQVMKTYRVMPSTTEPTVLPKFG
jgi:cell division protein FtsI (penicillin-binding protein 3)